LQAHYSGNGILDLGLVYEGKLNSFGGNGQKSMFIEYS